MQNQFRNKVYQIAYMKGITPDEYIQFLMSNLATLLSERDSETLELLKMVPSKDTYPTITEILDFLTICDK